MPKIGPHVDATQAEYDKMTLKQLILVAYNVKEYQFSGPDWMADKQYDIVAKMPAGASVNDAPMRLQALLEDRFKLVVHRATKNQQVMGLEVANGGPKLTPASDQPAGGKAQLGTFDFAVNSPDGRVLLINNGHEGSIVESSRMTMSGLADILTRLLREGGGVAPGGGGGGNDWKVVVNQTGLAGDYQVSFNSSFPPAMVLRRISESITVTQPGTISKDMMQINEATYEQQHPEYIGAPEITDALDRLVFQSVLKMGLKLEVSKAPVEMLVVDHAEKNPTAN